jgi:hypothetical protein|eukprot:COSAG06_NODE_219_length_20015_cov_11.068488_3_plen_82_part_00
MPQLLTRALAGRYVERGKADEERETLNVQVRFLPTLSYLTTSPPSGDTLHCCSMVSCGHLPRAFAGVPRLSGRAQACWYHL